MSHDHAQKPPHGPDYACALLLDQPPAGVDPPTSHRYTICSARLRPRRPQTARPPQSASARVNARVTSMGSPEMKPRPDVRMYVIGLSFATAWIHPWSRCSGT